MELDQMYAHLVGVRGGDERAFSPQHPGQLDCGNSRFCQLVEHVVGHDGLEGGRRKWQQPSVAGNEEPGWPGAGQGRAARAQHARRDVGINQVPQGLGPFQQRPAETTQPAPTSSAVVSELRSIWATNPAHPVPRWRPAGSWP